MNQEQEQTEAQMEENINEPNKIVEQYTPNGVKINNFIPICDMCRYHIQKLESRNVIRTDIFGSNDEYIICSCNVKHVKQKIIPELVIDSIKQITITETDVMNFDYYSNFNEDSCIYWLCELDKRFREHHKLNNDYRDVWIPSMPIDTSEGTFYIEANLMTNETRLNYKGTEIKDDLYLLAKFLLIQDKKNKDNKKGKVDINELFD